MTLTAIDHVQIAAPPGCEAAARRFYGELLGLPELPKPKRLAARGGVWFAVGERQQLHVGVERDHAPARKAHPALAASDLDVLASRLAAAGHPVRWDNELPGVKRFFIDDPWLNRIEIVTARAAKVGYCGTYAAAIPQPTRSAPAREPSV